MGPGRARICQKDPKSGDTESRSLLSANTTSSDPDAAAVLSQVHDRLSKERGKLSEASLSFPSNSYCLSC
ncbi:hypothetical protein V2G26_014370 [Clonostachys chloroleuca]